MLLFTVLLFTQVALAQTAPTLSFPINSQVPPVARIGELLSFTFSSSTFTTSTSSILSYTLENDPPSWLFLDSDSRRIYGTPQDDEVDSGTVVGVTFTLVATDSTGSTASDNVTLVVSRNAAPTIQVPLAEQIQSFGNYSEPSSILCRPDTNFIFTFAADTFSDPSVSELNYYAISSNDDSPLPSWISFDAGSLAFTGTTPPFSSLVEPPQTFSVKLIASDVVGFSGVWIDFSIVVGSHTLSANEPNIALNVTAGIPLTYSGLVGNIELDGIPVLPGNINATAQNPPSWLSFDEASWNISGTAPENANSTSFSIVFKDAYSDTLNITFDVKVLGNGSVFSSTFPTLSVEPGKHLSFDLAPYLLDSTDVDVAADIQPATPWLSWDVSLLTLSGDVPSSATKSVIDVTFTVSTGDAASSRKVRKRVESSQSQKLTIQINSTASSTTSSQTATSSTSSATSSAAGTASQGGSSYHPPKWTIIAIVISAVVGLALVIAACFYCCRRRKKHQSRSSLDDNDRPSTVHQEYLHTPRMTILGSIGTHHGSPDTEKTAKLSATAALKNNRLSPNEKTRRNKLRKSSILRSEVIRPGSPHSPLAPSVAITTHDDDRHSEVSTPASRLKDWFASVRSFRVVHMRRPNPRFSDSYLSDDSDNASHRDLGLDVGLGFTRSGVLSSLRTASRDSSFRSDVEVGVPTFAAADHGRDDRGGQRRTPPEILAHNNNNNNNISSSEDRKLRKGKKREATPLIPRPLGPTPEAARTRHVRESERTTSGGDPFTDSPILGVMTPDIILTTPPGTEAGAGPSTFGLRQTTSESANLQQLLENAHPYAHHRPPQRRAVSSSFFHARNHRHRRHPSLRPARSQVSFTAAASIHNSVSSVDSMRSRTRRFARKASSHAKGAVSLASMALGQPKRRTLAALRKNPHLSLRSSKRSIRAVFENADADIREGDVGDIYSPVATSSSSRRGRLERESSSRRGISGFLNPRIWPQPARTGASAAGGGGGSSSPMPWPPTPEIFGGGGVQGGASSSTATPGQAPVSTSYSNPYRWKPVGKTPGTSHSHSSRTRSRLDTPLSARSNSSNSGSFWSRQRRRRQQQPRKSTSRSKLSSAGGSGSGRLNGHSFRSFRMQQPQLPIRRRPVGAPERMTPQSNYSTAGPGGGSAATTTTATMMAGGGGGFPSPLASLPSPIQENGGRGGAGLGISTYEDIVSSSPFHPSRADPSRRSSWTTISGSARGVDDTNNRNNNNNNNNSSSSGGALDSSSTGTLPNWIVFGRAEDIRLNDPRPNLFHPPTQRREEDVEGDDDDDSWFGLDAVGNPLPNRESPVIRSPVDWRRFGPSSPTLPPVASSSAGRGRSREGSGSGSGSNHGARGHARRSMFLGGGAAGGGGFGFGGGNSGGGGGGGGRGGGLRIVNPGNSTTNSIVGGSVKASTTAQSNRVSEGPSTGGRVFL